MDRITQTIGRVLTKKERYFQNTLIVVCILVAAALYYWTYYLLSVYAVIVFFIALQILLFGFVYAARNRQDFTYTVVDNRLTIISKAMNKEKQLFNQSFDNLVSRSDYEHLGKDMKELKKEYDQVIFAAECSVPDRNSFLEYRQNGKRVMLIISPNSYISKYISQALGEIPYDEDRG